MILFPQLHLIYQKCELLIINSIDYEYIIRVLEKIKIYNLLIENYFYMKGKHILIFMMWNNGPLVLWLDFWQLLERRQVVYRCCVSPWWYNGEQSSHALCPVTFQISLQVFLISFSFLLIFLCVPFSLFFFSFFPGFPFLGHRGQKCSILNKFSKISFFILVICFSF